MATGYAIDGHLVVIDLDALRPGETAFRMATTRFLEVDFLPSKPLFFHWILRDPLGRWFAAGHLDREDTPPLYLLATKPTADYVEVAKELAAACFREDGMTVPKDLEGARKRGAPPAMSGGPEIPPERASRPMKLKEAAQAIYGDDGIKPKSRATKLRRAIVGGRIGWRSMGRESYVFDLRNFTEGAAEKFKPG